MAYPPRQFQTGGVYHVVNRGVDKQKIFKKPQDFKRFILGLYFFNDSNPSYNIWENLFRNEIKTKEILQGIDIEDKRKKIVKLTAFTLMSNHYHLIIEEIREGGISLFMNKMGGYTKYFNNQYDRVGPLFQGRYKSITIKDDIQLVNIFNYVHTNPVELVESDWKNLQVHNKKRATDFLNQYNWSSYHDYIGNNKFPAVIDMYDYLKLFGSNKDCMRSIEDWIGFKSKN